MDDQLKKLREEIDEIDDTIVDLLSKRMAVAEKVGKLKKEYQVPALDTKRLKEVMESKKTQAKIAGISETFIENVFKIIHDYSVELQKKV